MILGIRPLNDVANVNSFEPVDTVSWYNGTSTEFYFQTVDLSLDLPSQGYWPSGRRYMAPATSTLSVVFRSVETARTITRLATQPFPEDASIWKVTVLPTDNIVGTPQILLTLTEPGKVRTGLVKSAVRVLDTNTVGC